MSSTCFSPSLRRSIDPYCKIKWSLFTTAVILSSRILKTTIFMRDLCMSPDSCCVLAKLLLVACTSCGWCCKHDCSPLLSSSLVELLLLTFNVQTYNAQVICHYVMCWPWWRLKWLWRADAAAAGTDVPQVVVGGITGWSQDWECFNRLLCFSVSTIPGHKSWIQKIVPYVYMERISLESDCRWLS